MIVSLNNDKFVFICSSGFDKHSIVSRSQLSYSVSHNYTILIMIKIFAVTDIASGIFFDLSFVTEIKNIAGNIEVFIINKISLIHLLF